MSDLIERLRYGTATSNFWPNSLLIEAADRIAELEAANAKMRRVLEFLCAYPNQNIRDVAWEGLK